MRLFNFCYETEIVPRDWCRAFIVPLYKGKGTDAVIMPVELIKCSNSRGFVECSWKAAWDSGN